MAAFVFNASDDLEIGVPYLLVVIGKGRKVTQYLTNLITGESVKRAV